ncbi:MAG: M48 family metalloprotease [Magnetococcales bacterium]|nr:M48 family metalloprotease [Magnetococcales bacterium]
MPTIKPLTRALLSALALAALLALATPATARERDLIVLAVGPETTEILRRLGEPLARAADLPPEEVRFHVVLNPALNAFALPNRNIVFNSGLLLAVKDRDELAGVMAHEIGHLKAGHHLQLEALTKRLSIQTMISAAAGLIAAMASRNGQVGQAVISGGAGSAQLDMLEAIRNKESQSDRIAVSLLAKTGFNPEGLASFMNRLVQQQRISTLPPPYLLTHPITTERLLDSKRMAAEEPRSTPRAGDVEENLLLARARSVLEAESNEYPEESIVRFQSRLRLEPNDLALEQGLAESLRAAGRLPEAEALWNKLLKNHPGDPYLLRHRGVTRTELGLFAEAAKDFEEASLKLPEQPDLLFRQAFAFKELKKPREAIRILRKLASKDPDEPRYWYLLGLVESDAGHAGEGHLAMGRYNALILERNNALWHFQEAIRLLPNGSTEQAIAREELKQARKIEVKRAPEEGERERKRR